MRTVKLIFIVALLIAYINADSISLIGVIRDQAPNTMKDDQGGKVGSCGDAGNGFSNTDFQISGYTDNEKNLVGPQCTKDNFPNCGKLISTDDPTPKYAFTGQSEGKNVRSPSSFYNWFHNSAQTRLINHTIVLQEGSNNVYSFESEAFFPIDNKGWKDYHYKGNTKHNYAFCTEAHTKFGYRGGETFKFFGDDDVWVYIDSYLVIDLGSLHTKLSMEIKLDEVAKIIGLKKNNNYRLDFFHCERHTTESNFQVYTSLDLKCNQNDWCGICEGSGQSCCTADYIAKNCPKANACTTTTCKKENGECQYANVVCTPSNKCVTSSCDLREGCVERAISCDDNNKCTEDKCNADSGCSNTPLTCPERKCFNAKCDPNEGCVYTPKTCDDGNACTEDSCDANTGQCRYPQKNCNDNNPCTTDTCDSNAGCINKGCDDGNRCTDDTCIAGKGCSFAPKQCGNEKCVDYTCNPGTGACSGKPVVCVPQDMCHNVVCSNTTGCEQQKKTCDDGNACTTDLCNPTTGCYTEDRICNDNNKCTEDSCSPSSGCKYAPVNIDDKDMCTDDSCTPSGGVVHTTTVCNDNDVCTLDSCIPSTGCKFAKNSCADTDPCTEDKCEPSRPEGSQCTHTTISGCTGCKYANGTAIPCTTTNACFPAKCDVKNMKCSYDALDCDDGNACTNDGCQGGKCTNDPMTCTPPNKCMLASCDIKSGCVFKTKTCDDFNPCTKDSCNANGDCVNTPIDTFCTTCGNNACSYNDPCSPSVCNTATSTCSTQNITCNDNNPCTTDRCQASADKKATCSNTAVTCPVSADACSPNVCSITTNGCAPVPVSCPQSDPCKVGSCQVVSNKATCVSGNKNCSAAYVDACNPAICKPDGTCETTKVICNDNDPCTDDVCHDVAGVATCSAPPKSCGTDICGPMKCNSTSGACETAPLSCDDGNDCTDDFQSCGNSSTICTYKDSNFCNDSNFCTNDLCNGANFTTPCSHENITCEPNRCQIPRGCNVTSGCMYDPVDCSALVGDACKVTTCDVRDGCILEDRVCPKADDDGCFKPACNSSAVVGQDPCLTIRKDNFGTRLSNNGVICAWRYDDKAKKIAIGTGAAVGIAIGAAAAAGFIGYGGKKGYDYWKTMQNERFNGVQNNPLYDGPTGETENPLYNRMSTQI